MVKMAFTRTATSTITRQRYDPKSLEDQGVIPSVAFSRIIKSPRRKSFRDRVASRKNSNRPTTPKSPTIDVEQLKADLKSQKTQDISADLTEGRPNIFPETVFGEYEAEGKSKIQRADEAIAQWEEVKRVHSKHYPRAMTNVQWKLDEAKAERAALEDNEENNQVGVKDLAGHRIATRLKLLEWGLSTSKCAVEKENISAVIEGYKSGAIPYSKELTIVYGGKIVDKAPTYADFLANRQERLDRYAAEHGSGWVFYEEPLDVHPESTPIMKGCATYNRAARWHNLASWNIYQGYEKRVDWVARLNIPNRTEVPESANFLYNSDIGTWYAGFDGPRLIYRVLLDSGATYPSLSNEDLSNLGIDNRYYPCQALTYIDTASENDKMARIYELFVQVLDTNHRSLVDPNDPVWPGQPPYLGGLCPVIQLGNTNGIDPQTGRSKHTRLSGMLPFLACYTQVTPNRTELYLGEDRRHVLGGHRMPGQKRWDLAITAGHEVQYDWTNYDDPVTTFSHRQGQLVDQDEDNSHGSYTTVMKGTPQEAIVTNNPGRERQRRLAALAQARAEASARARGAGYWGT